MQTRKEQNNSQTIFVPNRVQHGMTVIARQQCSREDHRVESDIILANELIQLHVGIACLPPALPLRQLCGCDADVANGRIKPHVEDLLLVAGNGDGGTPLQIAGDAALAQTVTAGNTNNQTPEKSIKTVVGRTGAMLQ